MPRVVMVVEQQPVIQELLRVILRESGCDVRVAWSALGAVEQMRGEHADLILLDTELAGTDCWELLPLLDREQPGCRVVMLTDDMAHLPVEGAHRVLPFDVLEKPFQVKCLQEIVHRALAV